MAESILTMRVLDAPFTVESIPSETISHDVELRFRSDLIANASHGKVVLKTGEVIAAMGAITARSFSAESGAREYENVAFTLLDVHTTQVSASASGSVERLRFSDGTTVRTDCLNRIVFRQLDGESTISLIGVPWKEARGVAEAIHGYTKTWRRLLDSEEGTLEVLTVAVADDATQWAYHRDKLWHRHSDAMSWRPRFAAVSSAGEQHLSRALAQMRADSERWVGKHRSHLDKIVRATTPSGRLDGVVVLRWLWCEHCDSEFVFNLHP